MPRFRSLFLPRAKVTQVRGVAQTLTHNGRVLRLPPLLHPAAVLRNREELLPAMEADFRHIPALRAASAAEARQRR